MKVDGKSYGLARLYYHRIAMEAMLIVSDALCVSPTEMISKKRAKSTVVFARQMAMYLAHVVGQMSLGQVATEFGRERTTVGYSCNAIEDRRDSPIFDNQVEYLEAQLREKLTVLLTQDLNTDPKDALGDGSKSKTPMLVAG